ncbi:MAG: SelB C-terminal domain-containing protein, partial [Bryobacteraceae bacterium]
VSSATGAGLPQLREELLRVASSIPGKDASQHFRLPVDRAFSMRGFGAVVTGTLAAGVVRTEQEIELHPGGRRVRVRGIQVHGSGVDRAAAGQRTALNLSGIDTSELRRGMVLTEAGRFSTTRQIDAAFDLLPSARPLKHRAPVHFHAGTSEVEAEARLTGTTQALQPGHRAYVRFLLREPLLLLPGDRFIARMFSPVVTIGGGVVLDIAAPRRAPVSRLETLERGTLPEKVSLLVRESGHGIDIAALIARTGLREDEIQKAAAPAGLVILNEPRSWLIDPVWFQQRADALHGMLKDFHREKPLLPGMSKEELRMRLIPNAPEFILDALLTRSKTAVAQGDLLRLASHRVALKSDEENATSKIEEAFRKAGLAVPSTAEALAKCGVEPARAKSLLQLMLRDRRLVRITEDLVFHPSAIENLRGLLAAKKGVRFGVAEFKDWTGISRKYAIPLLEFLDREHVTKREGDERLVL